jgi:glycosyltransferase involved in cell wall biosynthesis
MSTLKFYINRKPKIGPWGGGVKTVNLLVDAIRAAGHDVVFSLNASNIDVIFCMDPRPNDLGEWYGHFLQYRKMHGAKIVQRVGDIGTHSKPELTQLVRETIPLSDSVLYISQWAADTIGASNPNQEVIDLAPPKCFYDHRTTRESASFPMRVVTHHWSDNPKKGGALYKKFDDFIGLTKEFEFTFIGRLAEQFQLKHSTLVEPIGALELSELLPQYDVYLTASIEEAGGNHSVEAMACGLPIVYHDAGGGVANFCCNIGEGYRTFEEMLTKLRKTKNNYRDLKNRVLGYNRTLENVCEQYVRAMESV